MTAEAFTLHTRLAADTRLVADLPLCRTLLMNDAQYPWCILVPRVAGIREPFELRPDDQARLWHEVGLLAKRLKDAFAADKMNIATLGNSVPQLHVHVIVRHVSDPAWPAPVWGARAAVPYTPEALNGQLDRLRRMLADVLPASN
jgi:diadenosine tetraphosphate (Ap4A) HIT family hydrolase